MSSYLEAPVAPGTYYEDPTRGCIAEGERFTFKYPRVMELPSLILFFLDGPHLDHCH